MCQICKIMEPKSHLGDNSSKKDYNYKKLEKELYLEVLKWKRQLSQKLSK